MPRGSRNYSLVINSRFRPFSYQEMLAPTMQATQAHQALEDAYGTLGMQAGTVEAMLNRELDEKAYNQYQGYMQGLQESADLLAREGLNPALRGSLSNLKSRYSQEIVPIQKAAERREKLAEEQRKLGNNAIFDFNASTTGLDRFMDNPSLNYRYIDRMALLQEAQDQFSQFQKDLVSMAVDPNLYKDAFHNTILTKYGFTPDEAAELTDQVAKGTANLDNISNEAVRRIAENLYNTTNVDSWNSKDASNRVWRTIAEGIKAGVGNETPQIVEDIKKHEDYKYAQELALLKEKAKLEEEKAKNAGKGKGKEEEDEIGLNSRSYLQATGKEAKYNKLIAGLTEKDANSEDVKLSKEVFGENYDVDPMKVYEALKAAGNDIYDEMEFTEEEAKEYQAKIRPYQSQLAYAKGPQKKALENSITSIRNQMMKDKLPSYIASKYGVERILTDDEYNMLKDLNYTHNPEKEDNLDIENPSIGNVNDLYNSLDKTSSVRTVWSTSMSGYEIPSNIIINNLARAKGSKNVAIKLNSDGTATTKGATYKDMNLKDDNNKEGKEITDISYSEMYPGYVIITVGTGNDYLVYPDALGSNYAEAINYAREMLADESPKDRSVAITKMIAKMLNNYNPTKSKTSSNV